MDGVGEAAGGLGRAVSSGGGEGGERFSGDRVVLCRVVVGQVDRVVVGAAVVQMLVGRADSGTGLFHPVHGGEHTGTHGVQAREVRGREAVGADEGEVGVGESRLRVAKPYRLLRHVAEDQRPQRPVVGFFGAGQGEREQALGFAVGRGVERHEGGDFGDVGDGTVQVAA